MGKETADVRYVALGDSFTEGVGDDLPDGSVRGWADLVAQGWADVTGSRVHYANLAIRGRLVWPIVDEQLERALALGPTHLSFNGGGNDMLRPRMDLARVTDAYRHVLRRCDEEGVTLIVLSGANPSHQLPFGRVIRRRGDVLSRAIEAQLAGRADVIKALNWPDRELGTPAYWSADRLHLNTSGHHRVAARVLTALGVAPPQSWWDRPSAPDDARVAGRSYYREHVLPWLRRRLTGTSSGDGREPKHPMFTMLTPSAG